MAFHIEKLDIDTPLWFWHSFDMMLSQGEIQIFALLILYSEDEQDWWDIEHRLLILQNTPYNG